MTATRSPREVREVPSSVSVIDSAEIEAAVMTQVDDLVRHLPGVSVRSTSGTTGSGFILRGIGGNRVLTQIDGVAEPEEFEFSRLRIPKIGLDLDAVATVEIVRGGHSSLFGSDALGGIVSIATKDPTHYLRGRRNHIATSGGWDGRDDRRSLGFSGAHRQGPWEFSADVVLREGSELGSQGNDDSLGAQRTVADPRSWDSSQGVFKVIREVSPSNRIKFAADRFEREGRSDLQSRQGVVDFGAIFGFPPGAVFELDRSQVSLEDRSRRLRLSAEQLMTGVARIDQSQWRVWLQQSETRQDTLERLTTTRGGAFLGPVVVTPIERVGLLTFVQDSVGAEIQLQQGVADRHLFTLGASALQHQYDQDRDSVDQHLATGQEVPRSDDLIFPTKYFPASEALQSALYVQGELDLFGHRLLLVPGLRWDHHDLDADQADHVYLSGNLGTEPPVDLRESAVSPRLGAVYRMSSRLQLRGQVSMGFRAPPFSHINGGFTHVAGDLTRLPNPDLRSETSLSSEIGAHFDTTHASIGLQLFSNDYDDFIELIRLGRNPTTGLIEFQQQNVLRARIRGIEAFGEWRPHDPWRVRAGASWTEGEDLESGDPLPSIEPPSAFVAVSWRARSERWGGELRTTYGAAKSSSTIANADDQFAPPEYTLLDMTAFVELNEHLTVRVALLNLLDETYWNWSAVQGLDSGISNIDFYSAPGRSLAVSFRLSS